MVKQIREWMVKGQDYAQGVALYETYGSSQVVLKTLRRGASDFTRQKLKQELEKLLAAGVTANVTVPVTAKPVRAVDTPAKRVHETPKRVHETAKSVQQVPDEVHQQRRAWFAERNHLHPQLELVATNAERLAMSLRILELGELLTESYAGEPTTAVGPAPAASLAHVTDAGEIRRLLANLRPQRSKLKKRSERATDLAQVESDIKCLEEQLKRDGGEPKLHQGNRNGA